MKIICSKCGNEMEVVTQSDVARKGGSVSSPKKTAANRLKAQKQWDDYHKKQAEGGEKDE
jgi:hypothetical protein